MTADKNEVDPVIHSTHVHGGLVGRGINNCTEAPSEPLPENIEEIFEFLAQNSRVIFLSQQIDDPDPSFEEKIKIARDLYSEDHNQLKFIQRFGKFLNIDQLKIFDDNPNESVQLISKELHSNLINKNKNVKNRRFNAMHKMINETEYFVEKEMMNREPLLYEQLIGQYLTETEKKVRDGYNPKNIAFSEILLNNIDQDRMKDLKKQQEKIEEKSNSSVESSPKELSNDNDENFVSNMEEGVYPTTPPSFRNHWGEFSDSNLEEVGPSSSFHAKNAKIDSQQKYITAGEREMLRQEFIGIMQAKFLNGEDNDFNYSDIDENSANDDLKIIQQDLEDKYFDESSSGEEIIRNESESEDDLDIFMKHLNKSPSFKN